MFGLGLVLRWLGAQITGVWFNSSAAKDEWVDELIGRLVGA